MKKFLIAVLVLIMVASCCFALFGCKDSSTVKVTEVTHSVFYAPLYVAINNGYFKEEGLKIELTNGGGADKCMTALISNQADIGLMGPEAAIYVYNEGREDYPVIFSQLTRKDGSFLMGKAPEENFSWDKLAGKEILGGRKGGVPAMTLEYALKKNNLVIGENVVLNYDVQFDMIIPAFEGGTGDYCTMFEPAASNYVKAGKGYKIAAVGSEAGDMPFTAFMATKSFMTKNNDKLKAFTKAIVKGIEFVNTKTADEIADAVIASFDGTDKALLAEAIKAYKEIGAFATSPFMKEADFEHLQDVIIASGIMTKRADFSKLVDNTIAKEFIK